jgi:predicted AlkP superfamily pyrophosphatase or phosphodiesterase
MRSPFRIPALALGLLAVAGCSQLFQRETDQDVRLVVLISVDQFPHYLYERYASVYTGGLKRLRDQGRIYTDAVFEYAETWTSAGHPTMSTGMNPWKHGIAGNSWYEHVDGEWESVSSVADDRVEILGVPGKTGRSPKNLIVSGLADWVLAADSQALAVTVSGKYTASVLLGGQSNASHIYWYEDDVGRFVTSSYYRDVYPDWVTRFNDEALQSFHAADSVWECTVPQELRGLARRDDADYENYGANFTFPHRFADEVEDIDDPAAYYDWWDHTPALDGAILALAREAVTNLLLGQQDKVDYLGVGLSQLDRVGHNFGPISLEQLDAVMHLDRELAKFFEFLDEVVGSDNYVVALTSDHGVVEIPEYRLELGEPGRLVMSREVREALADVQEAATRPRDGRREAVIQAVKDLDYVADVITLEQLAGPESSDSFVALFQRSYYPGRVRGPIARHGLFVRLTEGSHGGPEVTTHGTPYLYDRHVPLIFMGPGVRTGVSNDPVGIVDVAPTLARLGGLPFPDGLEGRPLLESED